MCNAVARAIRASKRTALELLWAIQSRYVTILYRFYDKWHVGGSCCSCSLYGFDACTVYLSEVEPGPPGGSRGGRWSRVADCWASLIRCCRHQCTATWVRYYLRQLEFQSYLYRLNVHLSSIVSSKPFQMPVEVAPRMTSLISSRLSSFGFSGTIAHGAFNARKPETSGSSRDSRSLYRNKSLLNRS